MPRNKVITVKTSSGDIDFCVFTETGFVVWIENKGSEPINFTIPKILPDGTRVNVLGCGFCIGKFKDIVVSDDIGIGRGAFFGADVESIALPPSCTSVPDSCFCGSSAKSISGLDYVNEIGECSFKSMGNLKEIDLSATPVMIIGPNAFDASCDVRLPYYCQ